MSLGLLAVGVDMDRFSINSMVLALIYVLTFSGTAFSATKPDSQVAAGVADESTDRAPIQYRLMTLSSTNKKRVDAMCVKFLTIIPKAMLIPHTTESTVYRLLANTYDTIELAKKRKAELLRYSESPFVVKNNQGYSVVAGSQLTETLALAEQKKLAGNDISSTIQELRLPLKRWQMKSTESYTIRDAVLLASKLAKIGVIAIIVPATE
jgi:hypothetical protein